MRKAKVGEVFEDKVSKDILLDLKASHEGLAFWLGLVFGVSVGIIVGVVI